MAFQGQAARKNDDPITEGLSLGPRVTTREQLNDLKKELKQEALDLVNKADDEDEQGNPTGKKVFFMRHMERLDRLYPEWVRLCFNTGRYMQLDLNMPINVPKRKGEFFKNDPPITEVGYITAQMLGRAAVLNKCVFTHVYCSPALRCVQSAHGFAKGYGGGLPVRVEPGLHSCLLYYKQAPTYLTHPEIEQSCNGIKLGKDYTPVVPLTELKEWGKEKSEAFFERINKTVKSIVAMANEDSVVVMAHADVVDAGSRVLRGRPGYKSMGKGQLEKIGINYPYGCVVGIEELDSGKWHTMAQPIPALTYTGYTNIINYAFYNKHDV